MVQTFLGRARWGPVGVGPRRLVLVLGVTGDDDGVVGAASSGAPPQEALVHLGNAVERGWATLARLRRALAIAGPLVRVVDTTDRDPSPESAISPVMATSPQTERPVNTDASAVTMASPADVPSCRPEFAACT